MVTTEGGEDSMKDPVERGANGYVLEPFNADKLKSVLAEVLG